jgi:hypothetical protein
MNNIHQDTFYHNIAIVVFVAGALIALFGNHFSMWWTKDRRIEKLKKRYKNETKV